MSAEGFEALDFAVAGGKSGRRGRAQQAVDRSFDKTSFWYEPVFREVGPFEEGEVLQTQARLFISFSKESLPRGFVAREESAHGRVPESRTDALSGAPLRERSTEVVRLVAEHVKGELPIIASGGVMSAADAVEKMEAGASLVQLFTGFIYEGPKLVADSVTAVAKWRREHA